MVSRGACWIMGEGEGEREGEAPSGAFSGPVYVPMPQDRYLIQVIVRLFFSSMIVFCFELQVWFYLATYLTLIYIT